MCELYAINSLRPVRANEHLGAFFQDAVVNPDGWGLAWRTTDGVFLYKEELSALDSTCLRYLLDDPIRSRSIVPLCAMTQRRPVVSRRRNGWQLL